MIRIETIVHKELSTFITSSAYLESKIIPISPIRALSQIHNPAAQAEDTILILAYQGETLVGYLGILPDDIFDNTGNFLHIGWFSCIWVDSDMRGKGIAKKLLNKAYEDWQGQVILAQFTQEAYNIYKNMAIFAPYVPSPQGLRLYAKSDFSHILPSKKPSLKKFSFIFKGGDMALNLFLSPFAKQGIIPYQYKTSILEKVGPNDLPKEDHFNYLVPTSLSRLNWILKYPWVRKADKKNELESRYYFSSVDNTIATSMIKISDEKENVLATFMLLKRGHVLKIPYLYALNKQAAAKVIHFVVQYMKAENLSTFVCYHPLLVELLRQAPMGFIYKKEKENPYLVGKKLLDKLPDLSQFILQDGDGDAAFT